MVARSLDSMTSDRKSLLLMLSFMVLMSSGCGTRQVVVEGRFPSPLMEPLPITLGVVYSDEFAKHEFYDEAVGRNESDWLVRTGDAQVEFWNTLLGGMFERVVVIKDHDSLHAIDGRIDAVLVPYVEDLQYTIPLHTNVKVYEIWMRYRFRLVDVASIHDHDNGDISYHPTESFADFQLSAYGKTPTVFLQSDEEAVNLAAVVALRDAGAHFATAFERVPEVAAWLRSLEDTSRDE